MRREESIAEAEVLLAWGEAERALEVIRNGLRRFPGDEDFLELERRAEADLKKISPYDKWITRGLVVGSVAFLLWQWLK
jgi:hypothetical protein